MTRPPLPRPTGSRRTAARSLRAGVFVALVTLLAGPSAAMAAGKGGYRGLFDVAARQAELQQPAFSAARAACLAVKPSPAWASMKPISALKPTNAYGSDNSAEDFSWAVMVLSGRALAGDAPSGEALRQLLVRWAQADAFGATQVHYDPYYALKRVLQPLTVAYAIAEPDLASADKALVRDWIGGLVGRIDVVFGKEVDENNHRMLADAVLAVWGSITGDRAMTDKAFARYRTVLGQMRSDGSLPLEARRGARALWYQRQALSSLAVIAEAARGRGIDLYGARNGEGRGFATLLGWLFDGLNAPLQVAVYSAQNHIPGPERDFRKLDTSFLETRAHGRHYMAWAEAAARGGGSLSFTRLNGLLERTLVAQRPLIDEFAGGNATCFWASP